MNARKVILRPRAWQDVEESASYLISEASLDVAVRFTEAVEHLTGMLATMPAMGVPCFFAHPQLQGLRRHPVAGFENWLIFYISRETAVEIVRVLHGARNIASILDEDEN